MVDAVDIAFLAQQTMKVFFVASVVVSYFRNSIATLLIIWSTFYSVLYHLTLLLQEHPISLKTEMGILATGIIAGLFETFVLDCTYVTLTSCVTLFFTLLSYIAVFFDDFACAVYCVIAFGSVVTYFAFDTGLAFVIVTTCLIFGIAERF